MTPRAERKRTDQLSEQDREIVRYLLDGLPEDRRRAVELNYFQDAEYLQRVDFLEDWLINAYLNRKLSRQQRRAFRSHYLRSPAHRDRFLAAAARLPSVGPHFRRYAIAALVALVLLSAGLLWIGRSSRHPRSQTVAQGESQQLPASTPAFVLFPGLSRGNGGGVRLTIPKAALIVKIRLASLGPASCPCAVALRNVDRSGSIWRTSVSNKQTVDHLDLELAAKLFAPADYVFTLSRTFPSGKEEPWRSYFCSVDRN